MTINNRGKMKRKKTQPTVFWNLNNAKPKRRTQKVQKIVLIKPIKIKQPKIKPLTRPVTIPKFNNRKSNIGSNIFGFGLSNKKKRPFNPKVQNPNKMPVMGVGLIPQKYKSPKTNLTQSSNIFGFLNNSVPKKIKHEPMVLFTPIKMSPVTFLKKESIFTRELNPWGDADMDGTMNHMDCNPREVGEDGILDSIKGFARKVGDTITGRKRYSEDALTDERSGRQEEIARKEIIKEKGADYDPEKLEKKYTKEYEKGRKADEEDYPTVTKEEYERRGGTNYKKDVKASDKILTEEVQKRSQDRLNRDDKYERWDHADLVAERAVKDARKEGYELSNKEYLNIRAKARQDKGMEQSKRAPDIVTRTGIISGAGKGEVVRGRTSGKVLSLYNKGLDKVRRVGALAADNTRSFLDPKKQGLKNISREIANIQSSGSELKSRRNSLNAKIRDYKAEGKSVDKLVEQRESVTTQIAKNQVEGQKRISNLKEKREILSTQRSAQKTKMLGGILSAVTPLGAVPEIKSKANVNVSGKAMKAGKKGRGRPKGPSGKYTVDGVPVQEAEFQQIRKIDNKKRKALGLSKVPTGSLNFNTTQQAVQRQETSSAVQQREQPIQSMQQQSMQQQPAQEVALVQQNQQYARPTSTQEKQAMEQQSDNVLNAPSIMGGELKNTGGILTEVGPNILQAPNVFKGGLRNVNENNEVPSVTMSERPNPNPYGNEYTEIEPGTGRVMVKRRPEEKWATGEAV